MDSTIEDLSDWVPVSADIFFKEEGTDNLWFNCTWKKETSKIAISLNEGSSSTTGQNNKSKDCLLSIAEIFHIHEQFCLIDKSLVYDFPKEIKPNYTPSRKKYEYISSCIEHYLNSAVQKVGKRLVVALMFNDEDTLNCYEESWNEFKFKSLNDIVEKAYKELEEVLLLRGTADSLLQLLTVYALEDQVFMNISDSLDELYKFNMQPFLELREMSHNEIKQAKDKLGQEMVPNIRQQAKKDFEDWSEQLLLATEAIQQLYLELYRKTYNLMLGGRDRMLQDKKKFEKNAFELHGLPRLFKLEVRVCQEDLKLHNTLKKMKYYQRDKIKHQLIYLKDDDGAVQEAERIEEEVVKAQIDVFDSYLDAIEAEERLYKSQISLLSQEHKDIQETNIFFSVTETSGNLPKELNIPEQKPETEKLKQKLKNIYHKRAAIRNKRKHLEDDIEKKEAKKASEKEKILKFQKKKETKSKELSSEKWTEERRKTLQRLKEYKKKPLLMESKSLCVEKSMTMNSTSKFRSHPESQIVSISKEKTSKCINIKKSAVSKKPTTSKTAVVPQSPLLLSNDKSFLPVPPLSAQVVPPPPPPPPPVSVIPPPPPPPPSPVSVIPPPPPPPPPNHNLQTKYVSEPAASKLTMPSSQGEITQSSISEQLKLLKKPAVEVNKKTLGNPFSLDEILATRSKLKTVSPDNEPSGKVQGSMDLSSVLRETMKNIRDVTEYSDQESDFDSDFE